MKFHLVQTKFFTFIFLDVYSNIWTCRIGSMLPWFQWVLYQLLFVLLQCSSRLCSIVLFCLSINNRLDAKSLSRASSGPPLKGVRCTWWNPKHCQKQPKSAAAAALQSESSETSRSLDHWGPAAFQQVNEIYSSWCTCWFQSTPSVCNPNLPMSWNSLCHEYQSLKESWNYIFSSYRNFIFSCKCLKRFYSLRKSVLLLSTSVIYIYINNLLLLCINGRIIHLLRNMECVSTASRLPCLV